MLTVHTERSRKRYEFFEILVILPFQLQYLQKCTLLNSKNEQCNFSVQRRQQ